MFFRAGVLGQMEELRDERLSKIVTWMQSWVRGYLSRKEFKKLQEQRLALQVCQRNLRKYLKLRTWPWYKLWQKVKPLLNVTRIEDEIAVRIFPEVYHKFTWLCKMSYIRSYNIRGACYKYKFSICVWENQNIPHLIYLMIYHQIMMKHRGLF